ncbi:hypothetical protein [Ilumatobacter sp.]|uniref:hypothetical protein n=1 Tax=Ilumatobacter sp. TaxID=1967498 RepID=UPI003750A646
MQTRESRRQKIGRYGADVSWANTPNRTERTRNGRNAGPSSLDWHIERLDPEKFAEATGEQKVKAGESAKKAYYSKLAMKSAEVRRGGGEAA